MGGGSAAPPATPSCCTFGEVGVGVLPGVAVGVLDPEVEPWEASLGGGERRPVE